MNLISSLLILLVLARALGQLTVRLGQPAIVGEILAGVVLGPVVLNFLEPSAALKTLSELAVFLIVFSAGLEMNFRSVFQAFRGRGLAVAFLSFVVPLIAGVLLGIAYNLDPMRSVFLGLTMAITALPVAIRILESFGLIHTELGKYTIASAILNDIAALLALGVILDIPGQGTLTGIAKSVGVTGLKLVITGAIILAAERFIRHINRQSATLQELTQKLIQLSGPEALFGAVLVFVLAFSSLTEGMGFHFILGAFFGALLLDEELIGKQRFKEIEKTAGSITSGFLGPVFFAYIGLSFSVQNLKSFDFVLAVLAVSIVSKILSGWMGGRLIPLREPEAWGMGIISNSRGVMGLVIAEIAFGRNFIQQPMFSTLVLMSVVTTLLTPILFRRFILPRLNKPGISGQMETR